MTIKCQVQVKQEKDKVSTPLILWEKQNFLWNLITPDAVNHETVAKWEITLQTEQSI